MKNDSDLLNELINALTILPGVGIKSAQRMAFNILEKNRDKAKNLSDLLRLATEQIRNCNQCRNLTEQSICNICSDEKRNNSLICLVENAYDIFVFEKTNSFLGKYHILGGALSPLDGIGPEDLNIDTLLERVVEGMEVIIATNPSVEGETTALYLSNILGKKGVSVTKLARGVPVGSDLEYIDEATLIRAMEGRVSV